MLSMGLLATGARHVLRSTRAAAVNTMGTRALSTHVSVVGLHWKTDETRLRQAFSVYGDLEEAALVTPAHSSTHLWARVVYRSFDEALEAVSEMNGQELDGRLLRVSIVDPHSDTSEDDEEDEEDE